MLAPPAVTRAVLGHELPPAKAWAERHRWVLLFHDDSFRLDLRFIHPREEHGRVRLLGDLVGYKVVPPAWQFVDFETGEPSRSAWPAPGSLPRVSSSIFHSSGVICAPFNRLAYKDHGGPHGDWSGAENWLAVRPAIVRATTIGEMLQVIALHLSVSPGRMS